MKSKKILSAIAEILLEIVITLIFLGLGYLVAKGLGFRVDVWESFDALVLVGVLTLAVLMFIIILVNRITKRRRNKNIQWETEGSDLQL